ncbi:protein FAM227B isoform X2 [Oryctolagus cuniculus]|uniref:protein FAM227B isoform X2 n=1 Tax=Oryctolagus cuniculus TaxID=9986 RepID=UPI00387A52CE
MYPDSSLWISPYESRYVIMKCQTSKDCWPREICFKDHDKWVHIMKTIKEDSSFTSIYSYLWKTVPRIDEAHMSMESRLSECSVLLKNHASRIFEWNDMISKASAYEKLGRYKTFVKKFDRKKKIMLSDIMMTKKNIEGCNFPGFKTNELTQLPRHLDAERIYLFVLQSRNYDERVFKTWKMYFLSEASIALLHDSFWWWFLHKFKPDRENQDYLFNRISESYVILFVSIPLSRKDTFFQIYPDCLTQAIYVTFQEAFPESSKIFNDKFKEDIGNNIFLWMSGLKPQRGFWTHWKLRELSTTTIHGSKKAPTKSIKQRIISSQESMSPAIDFNTAKILKNPRAYTTSTIKEDSRPTMKSHYISTGPEFYRILFNVGSQSPLILYYLKRHNLTGVFKALKQTKIKLTAIFQEPPPAPTYSDIIREAKKQFERNYKEFRIEKQRINEEIKFLKQRQERIDKELDRLQAKAMKKPYEVQSDFEKFLHKLRSEESMDLEYMTSQSSSSTEIYTLEEAEHSEKPEIN